MVDVGIVLLKGQIVVCASEGGCSGCGQRVSVSGLIGIGTSRGDGGAYR